MTRTFVLAAGLCAAVAMGCRERPAGDGPYADRVQRSVHDIERTVGVPFKTPPKLEMRSKAQVREFLVREFDEQNPRERLEGEEAAYKIMGLIPDTLNVREFLIALLVEQIRGFYDPKSKTLYIVEGQPDELVGLTISHELIHALQDQYVNLDSLLRASGNTDRQLAAQAVMEGQATHEGLTIATGGSANVASRLPGGWSQVRDLIRENQSAQPLFAAAPTMIQETLLFPYINGAEFIRRFKDRHGDSLPYARIPVSTEQILHDQAFFGPTPDEPTTVTLPAVSNARHESMLGEFGTRLFIFEHLRDQNTAIRAATGWDGDRYVVFRAGSSNGFAWVSVWDTPIDAAEFVTAMSDAMAKRYRAKGDTTRIGREISGRGRSVRITQREVDGRDVVLVVDVPAGASPDPIDLARVRLGR
jgi:hypothetical protein